MDFLEFQRATKSHVFQYLAHIQRQSELGLTTNLGSQLPQKALFPSTLLFTETPTHFAVDLLGAVDHFSLNMKVIVREAASTTEVLGSFNAPDTVGLFAGAPGVGDVGFESMAIMSPRTRATFEQRYPDFVARHGATIHADFDVPTGYAFTPIQFHDEQKDLWLRDVLLVNDWMDVVRARYYQAFWLIERTASRAEYLLRLQKEHPVGFGDHAKLLPPAADEAGRRFVTAAALATLSSLPDVRETDITTFVEGQAEILTRALGGVRVIAQPKFEWVEGNPDPDERWIQPDFLLVEADGRAHICDFKLPLFGEGTLTAGKRRRRRFKYPVSDGLAQLANYRDYFQQDAHQELLRQRGIYMSDPRCILIVGSNENYSVKEVQEAMRMYATVEVIDYDTLRVLFAMSEYDE